MTRVLALLLSFSLILPTVVRADQKALTLRAKDAVALLYSQSASGTMDMHCTATAYQKTPTGYLFVSAAHCIGSDDRQKEKSARSDKPFYITFDEVKTMKKFYPARIVWVGYQHRGEDLLVLSVDTTEKWPTIPIGDEKVLADGAAILNVASPLGLGKQVFHGIIASLFLDRPVIEGDINWTGSMVLQLAGVGGGSSGSAIISEEKEAIVGFLVGIIGGSTIIGIPASRFHAVQRAIDAKTYRWYEAPTVLP